MTSAELEHGLRLLEERLAELREIDADLTVAWDARPELPLAIVQLYGIEMLLDPLALLKRIDGRQPPPGHDAAPV